MNEVAGIKESDTGLAHPSRWDLVSDRQAVQEEQPLQVRVYVGGGEEFVWLVSLCGISSLGAAGAAAAGGQLKLCCASYHYLLCPAPGREEKERQVGGKVLPFYRCVVWRALGAAGAADAGGGLHHEAYMNHFAALDNFPRCMI